ncbi:MAG: FtsX-like permease family protein [Acidimicrobiales bacterium]
MTRLRLPLRLARREVRRRPGRTILVALLVALPVAGMAMAVTLIRTDAVTPAEEWERTHGQADAVGYGGDVALVSLPPGSRTIAIRSAYARAKAADGTRAGVEMSDLPLNDPLVAGIHDLVAGRAATRPGEVVLSAQLADQLGLHVGDELVLDRPALTATLVGEVEPIGCLSCGTLLVAPGQLPDGVPGATTDAESAFVLIDLPDPQSVQELTGLQAAGSDNIEVRELRLRADLARDDGRSGAVRWSLVLGALVLTVVGIVITAAFAVGARRQLVTIGQLSASGAAPATVRMALVLQGTVTGLLGSVAGLVLGGGLLLACKPLVERLLDRRIDAYDIRPGEIAAVVLIGVVAATLAALIPARTAARIPTLAALAGRRPLAPVSRRLVTWGAVSMLGGLALLFMAVLGSQSGSSGDVWALVAIAGGVGELLGACAIAPAVVARLEPLAVHLRGSVRLGARSLARHRARTGAVVSAVAAAGALAVAAGGLLLGGEAQNGVETDVPDDVVVVAHERFSEVTGSSTPVAELPTDVHSSVVEALPGAQEVALAGIAPVDGGPTGPGFWQVQAAQPSVDGGMLYQGGSDRALIADDALLDALRADAPIRRGLAETGIVVLNGAGQGGLDGEVVVTLPDGRTAPGTAVLHPYSPGYVSDVLVSRETVRDLDLLVSTLATMFELPEPLTAAQRGTIEDLQYDVSDSNAELFTTFRWSSPDAGPSPLQLELILTGVALVFSLFVVGVSLALAAAESKDERDILTIAGAPPGMLARSAGARAWLLAVIGAAMAVPVGFLPVVVFSWASDREESFQSFPLVFPTRTVTLLVVVVPLAVALASWSCSAVAQRLRPVRVSTAVFE